MIKILFMIPSITGGGAEKVLRNLVNNMDQDSFDITIQTVEEEKNVDKYLAQGIHYRALNHCKTRLGKILFSYWFRLLAELKLVYPVYIKGDYDIEVAYLECDATKVMSASTNKKALKIAWVHCDLTKKEGFLKKVSKSKKYYQAFDQVVCVSEDVRKAYVKLFGTKPESVVLYNVIDEDEIFHKSEEALPIEQDNSVKNLLAVGRLSRQKGYDQLIEACAKLKSDGYHFQLRILGEGPEREKLEGLIQRFQLEHIVELVGFVENPYPYMKVADCIVCSSRYEGLSTVVIEGLILGKIIVTTPCSGMKELLGKSEYGIIAEDGENGLYNSLKKIMDSKEIEVQYASAARKRGEDFKKSSIIQKTEEFLIDNLE